MRALALVALAAFAAGAFAQDSTAPVGTPTHMSGTFDGMVNLIPGPAGPAGAQGPVGPQGPAGVSPSVASIEAALAADSAFQKAVAALMSAPATTAPPTTTPPANGAQVRSCAISTASPFGVAAGLVAAAATVTAYVSNSGSGSSPYCKVLSAMSKTAFVNTSLDGKTWVQIGAVLP